MRTSRQWRSLSVFWLWCVLAISLLWVFQVPDYQGQDRFPVLLMRIWLAGPAACLILSMLLAGLRPDGLPVVRIVAAMHLGVALLATIAANVIRWGQSAEEAIVCFIVLLVGLVATVPVVLLAPRASKPAPPRARTVLLASSAVSTVALFGWSLVNIPIVEARARELAGNRPYCLQVVDGDREHRSVTNHLDLAGLSMLAPITNGGGSDNFYWVYHAILVVDGRLYNWSYMAQAFLPAVTTGMWVAAVCKPEPQFLDRL